MRKGLCSHCQQSGLSIYQGDNVATLLCSHSGRGGEAVCPNSHHSPQVVYGPNHPLAELDEEESLEAANQGLFRLQMEELRILRQ